MGSKKTRGTVFILLWAVLIVAGIMSKRMFGQQDLMVFYHLPAAVFLVLGFVELSQDIKRKRKEELNSLNSIQQES